MTLESSENNSIEQSTKVFKKGVRQSSMAFRVIYPPAINFYFIIATDRHGVRLQSVIFDQ